jgi:hypothetical protein
MSSQVELCEHHAKDCLQAAEKTEGARDASQACAGVDAGRACSIQAIEALCRLWTQGSTGIEFSTLSDLRVFGATKFFVGTGYRIFVPDTQHTLSDAAGITFLR